MGKKVIRLLFFDDRLDMIRSEKKCGYIINELENIIDNMQYIPDIDEKREPIQRTETPQLWELKANLDWFNCYRIIYRIQGDELILISVYNKINNDQQNLEYDVAHEKYKIWLKNRGSWEANLKG